MQSQAHSHSQYAAVPLPQHPHPPPPPHHPPSYHHPHPHSFASLQNGGGAFPQHQQSSSLAGTIPGQNGMMRFGAPLETGPMGMAGARHKKDIKRRTKTGCLTCRKRRIKCDEGHPTCRNCQKSKRECLGYDPIFKQQSGGHAAIQPAPAHPSPGTSSTRETASPVPGSYYTYPLAGGGIGGAPGSAFAPPPSQSYSQPLHRPHESAASLDPSLARRSPSPVAMASNGPAPTLYPTRNVNPIAVDELFSLNDVSPKFQVREALHSSPSASQREIDDFYRFHFAQGLDRLFETRWYSSRGPDQLRQNPSLQDFVTQCMEQFRTSDPAATPSAQSLEARLVWQLATMPRSASHAPGVNGAATDELTNDVLSRVDTVEHLLTGQYLAVEKVPPPPSSNQHHHTEYNERHFWHQLATFASVRDDSAEPRNKAAIDTALNAMRAILGMMENRDVLYSLAIARHIGGRVAEFHPREQLSRPDDPNSDLYKLEVARHFVEVEDQKGTTQVIQRICGMAMRSWTLQKR